MFWLAYKLHKKFWANWLWTSTTRFSCQYAKNSQRYFIGLRNHKQYTFCIGTLFNLSLTYTNISQKLGILIFFSFNLHPDIVNLLSLELYLVFFVLIYFNIILSGILFLFSNIIDLISFIVFVQQSTFNIEFKLFFY